MHGGSKLALFHALLWYRGQLVRRLSSRSKIDGGKHVEYGVKKANPASVPCHYAPLGPWS
jgi:hypothetical protein